MGKVLLLRYQIRELYPPAVGQMPTLYYYLLTLGEAKPYIIEVMDVEQKRGLVLYFRVVKDLSNLFYRQFLEI